MTSLLVKAVRQSRAQLPVIRVVRGFCSPLVAAKAPMQVELKADKKYSWCSCGRSKKQPFCDGSHKGSGMSPHRFRLEEEIPEAFLCCCKQTSTPPFCDGTHATEKVQSAEIGKPL
ncbi:CDGSH iron-sulfur domain-containing protein 3, mitochondrial-like [Actinia tenebrosa]|uniref:CDGSH iron-sulfur domain-containing protein 3, mitochondrial-like n=1 Tax=Actinia tenebrosa TaxID=6105 RepID=A0A6P8JCH8_ACTTE|nr:CDGSH iron-sulfur domain-containing protein 3, mitochondrial-like [Actinia tenebrosa]